MGESIIGPVARETRRVVACALLALATLLLFGEGAAWAHTVGLSRCDLTVAPSGAVEGVIVFSRRDAAAIAHLAKRDAEGPPDASNVEASFRSFVARGLVVRADGLACPGGLVGGSDVEEDGFALAVSFACPKGARRVRADLLYLVELPPGHRTTARLATSGASTESWLDVDARAIELDLPRPEDAGDAGPGEETSRETVASSARFRGMSSVRLGLLHILTGWDHLLFLAALVLGVRRLRPLVLAVSSFTVAHSITLALAALSVFAPSPRFVEPLIAASIAVVAFDTARRTSSRPSEAMRPRDRAAVTFLFGLVHGFGFASALRGLSLATPDLLPTLLGFNVGVEIGQLGVVSLVFALVAWLRRGGDVEPWTRRASWALGAAGLGLFLFRLAGG